MIEDPSSENSDIKSSNREDYAVVVRKRPIVVFHVLEQDIDSLISGYMSVNLAFAGAFFSATVTFWVAFFSLSPEETKRPLFLIAAVLATVLFFYFSVMTLKDWINKRRIAKRIKSETTVEPTFIAAKRR